MVERQAARLDRTFAALADPTRRAILARLRRRGATVTDLAAPFAMSLAAVSKHLRVLERAGLVERDVRGREHHCRLNGAPLRAAADWTAGYLRAWEDRLDALERHLAARMPGGGRARRTPGAGGARRSRRRS